MRYSTRGWIIVGAVIAAVDLLAPQGETLSEGCDAALEHELGRILVPLAVIQTAIHLLNLIPPRYDAIHHGFSLTRAVLKTRTMES